ncbi:hypothetical protein CIG2463D_1486 [Campylobacter iguaniorum]|uniref:hypothetical protein n=1 Tax=Campylobacter iguaniorum TaxID=1244531 RepID=UPI00073A45C7|nr:hypothetical protein [Campylobacter iguaniorum]ALV25051.1 hypothetical protein CIG2463D_1486 [Campylobacter iguaniorum]
MESKFITQTELSREVGVSKAYISKLIKNGEFDNCISEGKLLRKKSISHFYDRQNPTREPQRLSNSQNKKSQPTPTQPQPTQQIAQPNLPEPTQQSQIDQNTPKEIKDNISLYNEANKQLLASYLSTAKNSSQAVQIIDTFWRGKNQELKHLQDIKELINKQDAINNVAKAYTIAKTKLLSLPNSLAPLLAHKSEAQIQTKLSDAIYDALEELSHAGDKL